MTKNEIQKLLPWIMRKNISENSPLDTILTIMENYYSPINSRYSDLRDFFNPLKTTPQMVYYMACWFNLEWVFGKGTYGLVTSNTKNGKVILGRLRRLVSDVEHLIWWRGTLQGLSFILYRATGLEDIQIKNDEFHFTVIIKKEDSIEIDLIKRIVDHEKSVAMTWSLEVI